MYIEKLENYLFSMYVRPRSFGKSFFTSMILYYYNINEKENFYKLYKGLYIYENQTKKRNSYYIIKFNFSGMNISANKSGAEIEDSFNKSVYIDRQEFISKYNLNIVIEQKDFSANIILRELLSKFKSLNKKIKNI